MAEAAVAYVSLAIASPGIGKDVAKEIEGGADEGSKRGSDSILKNLAGITAKLGGIALGIGSALVLNAGWDRLIQIEDATTSMTIALGDAAKAGELLDKVMNVVTGTPFSYSNFASAASNLAGFGVEADKIPNLLTAIADAAASKGSRAQEFADRLAVSFGQMAARGVVGMDQINALSEVGVNGLAILANHFGVTTAEMQKMISAGAVPATEAMDALAEGIQNGSDGVAGATVAFGGLAQALGENTSGKIANMQTAFANLGAQVLEPLIPLIVAVVNGITEMTKNAAPAIGAVVSSLVDFFSNFNASDIQGSFAPLGQLSPVFSGIGDSLTALAPAFGRFIETLPKVGAALAVVGGGALDVFAGALGFLADNVETIMAWMPAIVTGFLLWSIAMRGTATASLAVRAGELAATPVYLANNLMRLQSVTIERQLAIAKGTATAATTAGMFATLRSTVATAASRVAMLAGAAAAGVAAAAQWAFNAAMSANPIMIVVLAIAALVGALIWFFTQTELGQQIWSGFVTFLGEAWANIASLATTVWTAISDFFVSVWNGIVAFVTGAVTGVATVISTVVTGISTWWNSTWTAISTFFSNLWTTIQTIVQMRIMQVQAVIRAVVFAIKSTWEAIWNGIRTFFSNLWTSIQTIVRARIMQVQAIIRSVVLSIKGTWESIWNGVSSFFSGVWNNIVNAVENFKTVFRNAFEGIRGFVDSAFSGVLGAVKAPINGIISLVNRAIGSLNKLGFSLPDFMGGGTFGLNIPKIPMLAQGGIVSGPTLAMVGEGKYQEAVVPLSPKFYEALGGGENATSDGAPLVGVMNVHSTAGSEATAAAVSRDLRRMQRGSSRGHR